MLLESYHLFPNKPKTERSSPRRPKTTKLAPLQKKFNPGLPGPDNRPDRTQGDCDTATAVFLSAAANTARCGNRNRLAECIGGSVKSGAPAYEIAASLSTQQTSLAGLCSGTPGAKHDRMCSIKSLSLSKPSKSRPAVTDQAFARSQE
jgi:hypothetical protein